MFHCTYSQRLAMRMLRHIKYNHSSYILLFQNIFHRIPMNSMAQTVPVKLNHNVFADMKPTVEFNNIRKFGLLYI